MAGKQFTKGFIMLKFVCKKLNDDMFYVYSTEIDSQYNVHDSDIAHKSIGFGRTELEAWKLAEKNSEYMKTIAEKEVSIANMYLHEIRDALQHI